MSKAVNLIKWLLKACVVLAVLGGAALLASYLYEQYQLEQRGREAQKSLSLYTDANDWQWLEEKEPSKRGPSNLQWRIDEDNQYWLRRVHDDHWIKAAFIKDDKSNIQLKTYAYWKAECAAGSEVVTSVTDSQGENWPLKCIQEDWGSYLYVGALWDDGSLPRWNKDFDGFRVNEDFGGISWNFDAAMRHLTLKSMAVPKTQP